MKKSNTQKLDQVLENLLLLNEINFDRQQLLAMVKRPLLSNGDFMLLFRIGRRTAYTWRHKKLIKFKRIGLRYYYLWADVLKLLQERGMD